MTSRTLSVEVPDEHVALLGPPQAAATRAREALALGWLREGRINQGQAAQSRGVTRWDILNVMATHQVASDPTTVEELRREIDIARRRAGQT